MGMHNVVYVATENDSVYAFDADQPGPPLWNTSFINPAAGITAVPSSDLGCGDLVPLIGITATPVIDPGQGPNGTLYVVSKVKLGPGSYLQQLHALDITTGLEQGHSPTTITAKVPGTAEDAVKGMVSFDPLLQQDRPALTLANGVVYLSFASHCDFQPYHGWILGYDETMMTQKVVFNTSANGAEGGFWEAGCGPGVDTNGDLIGVTGNGTFDIGTPRVDYGDSFLRLTPGAGTMSVTSFFTPLDSSCSTTTTWTWAPAVTCFCRSARTKCSPDDRRRQGWHPLPCESRRHGRFRCLRRSDGAGAAQCGRWNVHTPAYWQENVPTVGLQNMIYTVGSTDVPKMFVISNGLIQTPPVSASPVFLIAYPGASPVISATARPAASCGNPQLAWKSAGTACSMPSMRPT